MPTSKTENRDWAEKSRGETPLPAGTPGGPIVSSGGAERLQSWALHFLVFICGASIMSLEMVGARVLWSDFGSSVYVWGSIISIFMAALAAGYLLGGLLADRRPSLAWLAGIVGIAGAMVIVLTHMAPWLCSAISEKNLGPGGGPLAASLLLYFPPSLFLGAISPFAVRLQARAIAGMGNVAGRLYALSTIGSLLGTLGTTFVLIPAMRTNRILYILGALLMAVAIMALAAHFAARGAPRGRRATTAAGLFLGCPLLLGYFFCPLLPPGALRPFEGISLQNRANCWQYVTHEYESAYHIITVVRSFSPVAVADGLLTGMKPALARMPFAPDMGPYIDLAGRTDRLPTMRVSREILKLATDLDPQAVQEMRFSNLTESSLYLNQPGQPPATTYTKILHMGMALNPGARRVLVVGLGGGSVPRQFCDIYGPDMRVDVVEIDPVVLEVAREHFGLRDGDHAAANAPYCAYVEDARQFIRHGRGRFPKYDLILLDAYSGGGQIPAHLVTTEFIAQVRERLADDGVLVSNIISPIDGPMSRFYRSEYLTISEHFENIYIFPSIWENEQGTLRYRTGNRNLLLVAPARKGERLTTAALTAAARDLVARYPKAKDLDLAYHAANRLAITKPVASAETPVLTDAYAPVETMFWYERHAR